MKKIAVILAGCGRMDGSEIHESVLTLLALSLAGAEYQCFSLDLAQDHVTNHLDNEISSSESRNMLIESARIARGEVKDLQQLNVADYAGMIIPGGNGTAYNLFTLAKDGVNFSVNSLLSQKCRQFTAAAKVLGFICIAPAMIPAIYDFPVNLTLGNDPATIKLVTDRGAIHHERKVDEICIDNQHKIITTPAYMLAKNIAEAYNGISQLVNALLELA